ncbi:zinc ribbon domain-containing protein [uncultured Draconibacterium sp.]|uniref:zinc ribbon domain-containing protein n=1 Tax=uncultured Draconibacterium sp. TaxID=1573823 RepID=UPI0029C79235|nr:zinc ribbon domain-containing protein [uncultured Draconibacterium sp.]
MSQTQCPKCRNAIVPNDKFCPHCGENLEKIAVSKEQNKACSQCGKMNNAEAVFCEHCGSKLSEEQTSQQPKKPEPHKIVSKGAYSGKMNTGKSKLLKRLIIAAIIVVVIAVFAIIIWFQVDDNAEDKLKEALRIPGTIVIVGLAIYVAIFGKSKKGRTRGGYDDDDYDDDDYDDGGDDGDDDD